MSLRKVVTYKYKMDNNNSMKSTLPILFTWIKYLNNVPILLFLVRLLNLFPDQVLIISYYNR